MKKILLILILTFSFLQVSAYEPTDDEIKSINNVKEKLWDISWLKWKEWFQQKVYQIDKILINTKKDSKTFYALNQIKLEMINIYLSLWWIIENQAEKDLIEQSNDKKQKRIDFFKENWKNITTSLEVNEKCTKYFNEIDNLAKKNDFPTELIIATWSKESNCNLFNPWNTWWPFQMTSQYFEPGEITLDEFLVTAQKFIDFSKYKWNYFNTNTYVNYKQRFWSENINITYDNYTLRELQIHSILYNWVSASTTLNWNSFANANLNSNVTSSSDWLVTRFLKILNWRNNNK